MFKCGKHVIRDPVSYLAQMIAPQTPATTPPRTTADKGMDEGGREGGPRGSRQRNCQSQDFWVGTGRSGVVYLSRIIFHNALWLQNMNQLLALLKDPAAMPRVNLLLLSPGVADSRSSVFSLFLVGPWAGGRISLRKMIIWIDFKPLLKLT